MFIYFYFFINCIFFYKSWLEDTNLDMKLKLIFNLINNGDELDAVILSRLLKRVYNNKSEVIF